MTKSSEFSKFDATMRKLISVPHSEIKEQLETEKAEKAANKKRKSKKANK